MVSQKVPLSWCLYSRVPFTDDFYASLDRAAEGGAKNLVLHNGIIPDSISKANLAQTAFGTVFGSNPGNMFVAVCLLFFAFSTILSWNLFGKINFVYLFGKKSAIVYSILSIGFILLGSFLSNDLVWELTDTFNYLMVIPNAIAIVALSSLVKESAKNAKAKKKAKAEKQLEE